MLTVIVPVYNAEKFLQQCVESILGQDYGNIELILVNDGSTDGSGVLCDLFSTTDRRVRTVHISNGGVGNARNIGLDMAKGEYITFVDSDDYVSCDIYSYNIGILESDPTIDMLQLPFDGRKTKSCMISSQKELFDAWIFCNKRITNYFWDKIFRREILSTLRFPTHMRYEDRFLFSDVLKSVVKVYCSSSGCYYYRRHPQQITQQISPRLIIDQIEANLHTLKNIPDCCHDSYVRCFWDTMVLIKTLSEDQDDIYIKSKLEYLWPDLYRIWKSSNPIGIKLRLTYGRMLL